MHEHPTTKGETVAHLMQTESGDVVEVGTVGGSVYLYVESLGMVHLSPADSQELRFALTEADSRIARGEDDDS